MWCDVTISDIVSCDLDSDLQQGDNSLGAYLPPELAGLQAMTLAAHKDSGTAASGDGVASLADDQSSQPALPYRVNSTRGGGIPVAIEKRAKGKKVRSA